MRLKEYEKHYRLSFANGVSVEILKEDGAFGGLGQVKLQRRKLRNNEVPIMPLVRAPDGYEVTRLQFHHVRKGEGCVALDLIPHVRRGGRMEWVCCDGEDRWNVGPWGQAPERDRGGLMRLTLRSVERTIGGIPFVGFSYAYKFRSRRYHVYRIHDRATWELGGRATGNSFWMQGPFGQPHKTVQNKDDSFSTSWCRGPSQAVEIQQFLPLFEVLQGFTFQFDRNTLLVTAFEEPFHCRSLFQKSAGENHIVHWHQLCADLGGCLEFPPLQVLCAAGLGDGPTDRADQYCAVRDELQRQYAEQGGLLREPAVVSSRLTGAGEPCLETMERGLDELARAGCHRVYVPGLIQALGPGPDASTKALRQAGRRVSMLVEHAHQRGMEVAASLADCCAHWLVQANGAEGTQQAIPADEGGRQLVTRALRDADARRLLTDHLRGLKRSPGLDVLVADSPLDRIVNQFEWVGPEGGSASGNDGGRIVSLYGPRTSLVASLQKMGYRCPLAGAAGLACGWLRPGYEVLKGREFMFRDCVVEFPEDEVTRAGDDPLEAYFRGYANRVSYAVVFDAAWGPGGRLAKWWKSEYVEINKAFHAVREHMESSRLLGDDRGALWHGADLDVRVLWCYRSFRWDLGPQASVFDIMATRQVGLEGGGFAPQPLRVYLVQDAAGAEPADGAGAKPGR
ncbi:MAG: hypothetical protein AMK73_02095 [Planctomycetes bacterium SM23_32]|nr:MAG: hypothetical protein AMK73_02095 [Planctomycetes bacterium SM23_32]